jgi:glycosyltransferase involved in cell wall biosynthesis
VIQRIIFILASVDSRSAGAGSENAIPTDEFSCAAGTSISCAELWCRRDSGDDMTSTNSTPQPRPGLSILIPAYNEEELLEAAVGAMLAAAAEASSDYELVIVNDGSADQTPAILDRLAAADPHVRAIHHPQNRGIGGAICTAARNALCDRAIICPVDSPLSAEQLRAFLAASAADAIVVGYRPRRLGYQGWQQCGSAVYHTLACGLLGLRLRDINWIHMYPTKLFGEVEIEFGGIVYLAEVLAKAKRLGYRFVEIEAPMVARLKGVATISKPRTIWRTFWDLWRLWGRLRRAPK